MLLVPLHELTDMVKEVVPTQPEALVTCTSIVALFGITKPPTDVSNVLVVTPTVCWVPLT